MYREPSADCARLLRVRQGGVVEASDVDWDYRPTRRTRAPRGTDTQFDRATYDRLRVLTTELKRVVRDGGAVRVHWGPLRELPQPFLAGVFALV